MIKPRLNLLLFALLLVLTASPRYALAAPAPQINPPARPVALDAAPFGLNTHLASRYPDADSMNIPAAAVAGTGAGWAREDIHWYRVQPQPGVWDWTFTDRAFGELIRRGVKIVGVLGHPPGWATPYPGDAPSGVSFYAPDSREFAAFAQAVVRRYGKYIHHWEIWNEPDHPLFWKPAPDPAAYAALLKQTSTAIRAVDPQARILIGGFNPFDTSFLRRVADAGAWGSFDIIAVHPYVDPAAPEVGLISSSIDGVRTVATRYGMKPIWATEVGWSSGMSDRDPTGSTDEQAQADYLVRATLLMWHAGIERIFWYSLKDDPGNNYGLIGLGAGQRDYSALKPAYAAFRTLSRELGGASYVGMRDLFTRTTVFNFDTLGRWRRGDEPNGQLSSIATPGRPGVAAAALSYSFRTTGNDYVIFMHDEPIPIPAQAEALSIWTYGDGSGHTLKVWLRDANGEILQYALGSIGAPGWQMLQAPIDGVVAPWNRMTKGGNGRLDFPASLYAIVLDDAPDSATGDGTIYLDDLTALSGPEAYDVQLRRGNQDIDVLWAPAGLKARLPSAAPQATAVARDGRTATLAAQQGAYTLNLGPAPIYIHHTR